MCCAGNRKNLGFSTSFYLLSIYRSVKMLLLLLVEIREKEKISILMIGQTLSKYNNNELT